MKVWFFPSHYVGKPFPAFSPFFAWLVGTNGQRPPTSLSFFFPPFYGFPQQLLALVNRFSSQKLGGDPFTFHYLLFSFPPHPDRALFSGLPFRPAGIVAKKKLGPPPHTAQGTVYLPLSCPWAALCLHLFSLSGRSGKLSGSSSLFPLP